LAGEPGRWGDKSWASFDFRAKAKTVAGPLRAAAFSNYVTFTASKAMGRLAEKNPLVIALVMSVLVHLLLLGVWQAGAHFGWWKYSPDWLNTWTRWLAKTHIEILPRLVEARPKPPNVTPSIPLTFIEVDPETATADAPPDAKYYSSQNAKASNPDPSLDLEKPKVDGKQDKVARTMLNEKPKPIPFPLQPSPPPETKPEPPAPAPKPEVKPGDVAEHKPNDGLTAETGDDSLIRPRKRPMTVAEAKAAKGILESEPIRQEGGVRTRGKVAFNTKATPFGEYDRAFIAAVEQCWHRLLEEHRGNQRSGRVVIDFKLNSDGRITELSVQGNDTGEIYGMICQRAILDPAPYQKWPPDMLRTIGSNTREIRFTFYYN
jgi:outer membrane biosynthesis protein TonB